MAACFVMSGLVFLPGARDIGRATFTGRLPAGQRYSRKLSNELFFCLDPEMTTHGAGTPAWRVLVGPSCSPSADNFAAVVTPPLHGPNPLDIEAWQFDPDVHGSQNLRSFRFVLTKDDHDFMFNVLSDPDAGKVLEAMNKLGKGEGVIRILKFKRREQANDGWVFDWVEFRAELTWPALAQRR